MNSSDARMNSDQGFNQGKLTIFAVWGRLFFMFVKENMFLQVYSTRRMLSVTFL
jgi:hypothetical protein